MHFQKERIDMILRDLSRFSVKESVSLKSFQMKEGFFLTPAEADSASSPWQNFDCENDYWCGTDAHYWFRATVTVPDSFSGKPLWFSFATQKTYWDAVNPQFLLFLDGEILQGVDTNHREVLVTLNAEAGKQYTIDLQAYTGRDTDIHEGATKKLQLIAAMQQIDANITRLYYDIQVPNEMVAWLPEDNMSRMKLEKALRETVNQIDLRAPYSDEFYASVAAATQFIETEVYEKLAGHDDVIATCIGHTHIDVAWWWTVAQTKEKVVRSFATVLKLMEEYPDYKFMSSQPQIYKFLKQRYPELFEKIKDRVAEGRWETEGGMWLEADCNVPSGESLVRQFLHGKKFFKEEFNQDNKILWLPDVFGYSAALPQIMRKSGIDYFMTTKIAWNQFDKLPMDTFWWKGIDGTEIFTHLITTQDSSQMKGTHFTTYNGNLNPISVMRAWDRYQQKPLNNDVLISYGYGDGGGGTTRPMIETGIRMEKGITGAPKVRMETSRKYFEELYDRVSNNPDLPRWVGELYLEYHRGTYTSMARNKRSNRKCELLWQDVEFLSVWTEAFGAVYPKQEIFDSWENILLNQFHDILPGSSIHDVYEVTKEEYEALEKNAHTLIDERVQLLADNSAPAGSLIAVNTLSFERDAVIAVDSSVMALEGTDGSLYPAQPATNGGNVCCVSGIPGKGFAVFTPTKEAVSVENELSIESDGIETPFYSIAINEKGQFTSVYDKEAERELLQPGKVGNLLRVYEDKPMNYDNWDIEIYYTEKFWDVDDVQKMEWTEKGAVRATLHIERKLLQSTIIQNIHFYAHSRAIDFETYVDWKQSQLLLKAEFPVDINVNEATYDIQFGNLKRPTHKNTMWDVARFEVCAHKWADLSEKNYGVSLMNESKYGYGICEGNMTLTLLKSGILPNPVTDQEEHRFTYSLFPHMGDWADGETMQNAYSLNVPVYTAISSGKGETVNKALFTVDMPGVLLESVKQAEDGEGVIIRLYEYQNTRTDVTVSTALSCTEVYECNLLEECEGEALLLEDGSFGFTIKPYEIKTFRLKLK